MKTNQQLVNQLVVCGAMFVAGAAGLAGYGARALMGDSSTEQAGRLELHTGPQEAVVHIDGVDTDLLTPITGEDALVVKPGNHVVTFHLSTGESFVYSVKTGAGENVVMIPSLGESASVGDAMLTSRSMR